MFMMVSSASNVVFLRSRITLPKDTSMSAPLNTGSSTMCLTELKVVNIFVFTTAIEECRE